MSRGRRGSPWQETRRPTAAGGAPAGTAAGSRAAGSPSAGEAPCWRAQSWWVCYGDGGGGGATG